MIDGIASTIFLSLQKWATIKTMRERSTSTIPASCFIRGLQTLYDDSCPLKVGIMWISFNFLFLFSTSPMPTMWLSKSLRLTKTYKLVIQFQNSETGISSQWEWAYTGRHTDFRTVTAIIGSFLPASSWILLFPSFHCFHNQWREFTAFCKRTIKGSN